jgi:5-methylcytosine-specific restriction endonuclease McrA
VCHVCKRRTLAVFTMKDRVVHPRSPTVDHHPYPLAAGVLGHVWANVRCACFECNWKKGAQWSGQLPLRLDRQP